MLGAPLSEVWGEDFKTTEKIRFQKPKKKKTKHNAPLTGEDMKFRLYNELTKYDYEDISIPRSSNSFSDKMTYNSNNKPRIIEDDPDYLEFLEFKKMKNKPKIVDNTKEGKIKYLEKERQFNDLLLYIFTGFFLLLIYDNIYRLGKNSY